MEIRREANGVEAYISPRGEIRLSTPARGVLLVRAKGDLTDAMAQKIEEAGRKTIAECGTYVGFLDWGDLATYETAARQRLTRFAQTLAASIEGNHIFLRSPVVRLGVQAASMVVKGIEVYPTREAFDAALRKAVVSRAAAKV